MGRILDLNTYPIKQIPSLGDYVIGTDSEQNGLTVNFPISAFGGDGGGLQNNRFKIIKTGTAVTPSDVAILMNAYNPSVEVLADEIPIIATIRPPVDDEPAKAELWGLTGIGKGIYGVGGNITVLITQPFLLESRPLVLDFIPNDVINSMVIDYGAVADSNVQTFVDLINDETYVIEAGTNWYFQGNVGGDNILYGWQGDNGTFGDGGTTVTTADLFLIEDETGVNTQPSTQPTGLEKIEEGNGEAWRLIGRNPALYNNAGLNSIDFSTSSGGFGASGQNTFSQGEDNRVSGYGAIAMGSLLTGTGILSTTFGFQNTNGGYASFVQGYNNTENSNTGYSMVVGHSNTIGINGGLSCGVVLSQPDGVGTLIGGAANEVVAATNDGNAETNPMIIIGNGSHTTPNGAPWVATKRSNLLVGLRNGYFMLPSTEIIDINSNPSGKQVVTREWVLAQNYLQLGAVATIVPSGDGNILASRDEANYGDVGFNAIDASFSESASAVRGATGRYSVAMGRNTRAQGTYSLSTNDSTWASGEGAVAMGRFTVASGLGSMAINTTTEAIGIDSLATGGSTRANGRASFSGGISNTAHSYAEAVFGHYATDYVPTGTDTLSATDRVFTIGNGIATGTRADAFTVLGNGRVGIGISNFEADLGLERLKVNGVARAWTMILDNIATYANDAAAGSGGLSSGTLYKTATGELRIKL